MYAIFPQTCGALQWCETQQAAGGYDRPEVEIDFALLLWLETFRDVSGFPFRYADGQALFGSMD
jgi:hypothetical protein